MKHFNPIALSPARVQPRVAILLGTFNGAAYLEAQLQSYMCQTAANWSLIARDDGSGDETVLLLERFARRHPGRDVQILAGPRLGFVRNFLSLLVAEGGEAEYVAFSDQDDFWLPRKLERAVHALNSVPENVPAVYCGRTVIADAALNRTGLSPRFDRPPSFRNALVQPIGGGNTMVLNRSARMLIHAAGAEAEAVSHDWWVYQLVTGAGGRVIYDAEPGVLYRQHGGNLSGSNRGLRAKLVRGRGLIRGEYRAWNDRNLRALDGVQALLTPENRTLLAEFKAARQGFVAHRVMRLIQSGVHRQTRKGQASLLAAAALGMV